MSKHTQKIVDLRKEHGLSQADLAEALGVSQSTVSRVEKGEQKPGFRVVAKLARVLAVEISDLMDPDDLRVFFANDDRQFFFAFCPNPFCYKNEFGRQRDGTEYIKWASTTQYESDQWDQINFCPGCGSDLVKECPQCGRHIESAASSYCISCGTKIHERPTDEEKESMKKILDEKETDANDSDIPF